ncbi:hypothetical protein [Streptomyces sp. NPDC059788]|uniref:hypothetical protein n=1 Tax=Streptomyces sp. NPDC059788 TaxID=3346948 RepID=UPI0036677761
MSLKIGTYRLLGRSTLAYLNAIAPKAADLVADRFGRRPLAVTEVVLTNPSGLAALFTRTQAAAANIPGDQAGPAARLLRAEPRKLYGTTGLRPGKGGGTLTLINVRRNRDRRALDETLLYELVTVDQLSRPRSRDRFITVLRDRCGIDPQPERVRRAWNKDFKADDAEAAQVVQQLLPRLH